MLDINYDRKDKVYKWTDEESGEILTAPSGNKHELFKAAVGLLDPGLYDAAHRVIEKHPQLERVTWKAVELVTNGDVEILPEPKDGVEAMVMSQSDEYGRYAVTNDNGYYVCQCQHFANNAPITESGNRYCKHILGMYLFKVTHEDRF